MRELLREALEILRSGKSFVLATILLDSGSAPRKAGAHMIVREDGTISGTIGGGAVEYRAVRLAAEALRGGASFTREFHLGGERDSQLGMICGGDVTVFFQYVGRENREFEKLSERALELIDADVRSWLALDITEEHAWTAELYVENQEEAQGWSAVKRGTLIEQDGRRLYIEPIAGFGKVYVFGGGHVAQQLVPLLSRLDFRCVVCDDREEFACRRLFPEAERTIAEDFTSVFGRLEIGEQDSIVIMTRGHQWDYEVQRQALRTPAHYIGVMGSENKLRTLKEKLRADGFTDRDFSRCRGPVGVSIHTDTPLEIAVSVAAQLIDDRACLEGRKKKDSIVIFGPSLYNGG